MTSEVRAMLKAQYVALANHAIRVAKHAHGQKVWDFVHDPTNTR